MIPRQKHSTRIVQRYIYTESFDYDYVWGSETKYDEFNLCMVEEDLNGNHKST